MRVYKAALAMVSVLLLTVSSLLWIVPASGGGPAAGAWTDISSSITVNSGRVYSLDNQTYNMNASIYVYGTLYINYTQIRFGGTSNGQYGFYVYSGGSLIMKESNLTALEKNVPVSTNPATWGIKWRFEVDGNLWILNSEISYMWGMDDTGGLTNVVGGLQIFSTSPHKIFIKDSKVFNSHECGIYMGPRVPSIPQTYSGADYKIYGVTIYNISMVGLIAAGYGVNPDVQNCTMKGNHYKGGNYYAGAAGTFRNNKVVYNVGLFGFTFDPRASYSMSIEKCSFNYNQGYGYAPRSGTVTLTDCTFDYNQKYGIGMKWEPSTGDTNLATITVNGGQAMHNGLDGAGSDYEESVTVLDGVELAYNGRDGVRGNTGQTTMTVQNCNIHDNIFNGTTFNNCKGQLINNEIHDNGINGVYVPGGATAVITENDIHDNPTGILTSNDITSIIEDNEISDGTIGIDLSKSVPTSFSGNEISNHFIGIKADAADITFGDNTISTATTGLLLNGAKNAKVPSGSFQGCTKGIEIVGKGSVAVTGGQMINNDVAIFCDGASSFSVESCTFSNNDYDFELNGASSGVAVNTTIPISKIMIDDSDSTFDNYQYLDVFVADNATGEFVPQARIVVHDKDGNNVTDTVGRLDGWLKDQLIPEYNIKGTNIDDNNPMNVTIEKEGYIPYWGGPESITERMFKNVTIAFNYPPMWLDPNVTANPPTTHQKRPTISWNASWDWNSEDRRNVVMHHLSVYQDEILPDNFILSADVRQLYVNDDPAQGSIPPVYTFTKNLRYNHVFFVEITTYDTWGLSSPAIVSFRTINTRPTSPIIQLAPNPASNIDDITVVFVTESTDIDTDPVDDISYIITFEAFRNEEWKLLQTGSSPVLSSDLTRENDMIRATVKPFDGIELGAEVVAETSVVNFAPAGLVEYVEIEMTEDTPGINLVNFSAVFFDEDNDDMVFTVADDYRHLKMDIDSVLGTSIITPDPDFNGKDYVIISAQDGKLHPDQDWPLVQINATVQGVNDPPSIIRVNDVNVKVGKDILLEGTQGAKIMILPMAVDPDGEEVEFSSNMGEALLGKVNVTTETFSAKTGRVEFFLTNDLVGINHFNISATDGSGSTSTVTIQLTVANINDPPTAPRIVLPLAGVVNLSARDQMVHFEAIAADDPDLHIPGSTEEIRYVWDFGDGTVIDGVAEDGKLVADHNYLNEGDYIITLTATDNMILPKTSYVSIEVIMPPINETEGGTEETALWEYLPWIVLAIIVVIGVVVILAFALRKEPLEEIAVEEEKHHEEIMAHQQAEAQKAQEMLAQIMGTTAAGPALPSAPSIDQREALPAAPTEAPAPPMPVEPVPAPAEYQPPMEQAPPTYDPMQQPGTAQEPAQAPPTYMPPQ